MIDQETLRELREKKLSGLAAGIEALLQHARHTTRRDARMALNSGIRARRSAVTTRGQPTVVIHVAFGGHHTRPIPAPPNDAGSNLHSCHCC